MALSVWQACAFAIIIYLSGLQTIPGELYEAASIDGAGAWRQFRSITFPLMNVLHIQPFGPWPVWVWLIGFGLGFLLPDWDLERRAASRRRAARAAAS